MNKVYFSPDLQVLFLSAERIICLSGGDLRGFDGPDDLDDPTDPYNYQW